MLSLTCKKKNLKTKKTIENLCGSEGKKKAIRQDGCLFFLREVCENVVGKIEGEGGR